MDDVLFKLNEWPVLGSDIAITRRLVVVEQWFQRAFKFEMVLVQI